MEQMLNGSALAFATDVSGSFHSHPNRVAVPITDPEAHMSFYLITPTDSHAVS